MWHDVEWWSPRNYLFLNRSTNFGRPVVQIRCNCAKNKIPSSACAGRLKSTSSTERARVRKQPGLVFTEFFVQFSRIAGRAETGPRTSLPTLPSIIYFSRELRCNEALKTGEYRHPAPTDYVTGNLIQSVIHFTSLMSEHYSIIV